ncbi:MAG TPA: hypothetical protein VMH40_11350 [Myxococcaceae bacterium]|nr:hypothetical protein [Myxococcaceae bacterium]
MRRLSGAAVLSALALGCATGPPELRYNAWFPSTDPSASRRPQDCSDLASAGSGLVGDPLEPGRGKPLSQPADLGAGPVRLVWSSTVSGVRIDWVAPIEPGPRRLWALRVGDSGRCVVGTWTTSQLGFEVVKHTFTGGGRLEIVLLGLGPLSERGWMVLVTDGSSLWSGLGSRNGRPGALRGEELEFREEADRLRLVVVDAGKAAALDFDGVQFGHP